MPGFLALVVLFFGSSANLLADGDEDESKPGSVPEGHSIHGQVFNEGPRQKAYLMGGTGKVHFPITTKSPEAQKFFEQGIGQLHGFWFYEAERSFRTAAFLDPGCAMAYWGMAYANLMNKKRYDGFVAEAEKRAEGLTERELMYLRVLREPDYLARIVKRYPDDLEAKAFRAMDIGNYYQGKTRQPEGDRLVDTICREILQVEPMHPVHHYIIHAWDAMHEPYRALDSGELCGPAAPSIAHMWHMAGGHVYATLWKYADAVFMQEAAARVDHAQMMRDLLLPDQIHLYAHNNEWLTRNLCNVGRVHDAVALARNMIDLPRHPTYNMLRERDELSVDETTQNAEVQHDSSYYGRKRLFESLTRFELWDELLELAKTPYLDPSPLVTEQTEHYRFVGTAHYRKGDIAAGDESLAILKTRLAEQEKQRDDARAAVENDKKLRGGALKEALGHVDDRYFFRLLQSTSAIGQLEAYKTLASGRYISASDMKRAWMAIAAAAAASVWFLRRRRKLAVVAVLSAAALAVIPYRLNMPLQSGRVADKNVDPMYFADRLLEAGDADRAEAVIQGYLFGHQRQVWPLAHLANIQWRAGKTEAAKKTFEELRNLGAYCDLDVPTFARLAPMAKEFGYSEDWRPAPPNPPEGSKRPKLDTLGPFRWQPPPAPEWTLKDAAGKEHSLKDYKGKPVVVIFYLGAACLHCAKQLAEFGPKAEEFQKAGIQMIAVSTDKAEGLEASLKNYGKDFPFPLVSDSEKEIFKKYRCFDDFENLPLHGTFVINGDGKILWHDISFEPFMDVNFVLTEAQRLLTQERIDEQYPARSVAAR